MNSTSSITDLYDLPIDAIFAGFSKDWGGEGSPEEIAASLRENSLDPRDVEVW